MTSDRRWDFQDAILPYLNTASKTGHVRSAQARAQSNRKSLVRVSINGHLFILPRATCVRIPRLRRKLTQRLIQRTMMERRSPWLSVYNKVFYFDRNVDVFAAVVDYVQNDELHAPLNICPKLFAHELSFWGFDIGELEPCCFPGVVHFLFEQEKLANFHGFLNRKQSGLLVDSAFDNATEETLKGLEATQRIRIAMWKILDEPFSSRKARVYFWVMIVFILGGFFDMAASTHPYFMVNDPLRGMVPTMSIRYLSYTCTTYLFMDYTLRVLFYPKLKAFFREFINVTDGLALLSGIIKIISETVLRLDSRYATYLGIIHILQLLKILRLLRPMSKMTGFRLIYFTLKCSFRELLLVFMLLIFLTLAFSSVIYYLGDRESFRSIPHAMWFAITTMTTVGYGDIVPDSLRTMIIGSMMAVCGVIMMAMTTPIMVSNFHLLYINAVVGQPASLKNSDKEHKARTSIHSSDSRKARSASRDDRGNGDGKTSCLCWRTKRKRKVLPKVPSSGQPAGPVVKGDGKGTLPRTAQPSTTVTGNGDVQHIAEKVPAEKSEPSRARRDGRGGTGADGMEADSEGGATPGTHSHHAGTGGDNEDDDDDEEDEGVPRSSKRRNSRLLQRGQRSWYPNYLTSDTEREDVVVHVRERKSTTSFRGLDPPWTSSSDMPKQQPWMSGDPWLP